MHLIISLAETFGRLKGAKAQRWIVALLDPPMTLLNRIAQAGVLNVNYFGLFRAFGDLVKTFENKDSQQLFSEP